MANLLRLVNTYDGFKKEAGEPKRKRPASEREHDAPDGRPARGTPAPHSATPTEVAAQQQAKPAMGAVAPPRAAPQHVPPPPVPPTRAVPPASGIPAVTPPAAPAAPAPVAPPQASAPAPDAAAAQDTKDGTAAEALYDRVLLSVSRMFEAAVMEEIAPGRLLTCIDDLAGLCEPMVSSVAADRGLLRKAMGTYAEGEGFVLPHSVNVAVLAVELGQELGLAQQNLLDLCLAGLVHDLGSVRLPHGLLTKSESLTPSEWDEMRARPTYTYEALAVLGDGYARVAEIAYQVYERLDGSGYPRGLQGDEILPEARILGTVDFFESFAHPRPYKTALPGTANHGIQMLMQMADKFGSSTLKALVGSIGLFPIGSYVRLSSGEIGRVVDVKKENPMRPEVAILLDSERRPPETPRTLDLLSIPHIYVSRALTASDLRELGLLPPPSKMPALTHNRGPS